MLHDPKPPIGTKTVRQYEGNRMEWIFKQQAAAADTITETSVRSDSFSNLSENYSQLMH